MKAALMIVISIVLWSSLSYGDTYKYKDEKGTINFTNDINSIPKKFRKGAVRISTTKEEEEAALPQADAIDESLLPQKEEVAQSSSAPEQAKPAETVPEQTSRKVVIRNSAIISVIFLATLIPSFFVNNRMFSRLLISVSLLSVLTLLGYVTTVFFSKSMHILKKDMTQMKETVNKKEEAKAKALKDAAGDGTAVETGN